MFKKGYALILLIVLSATISLAANPVIIKFATLAPDGSTWMKVMREFVQDVKTATHGQVLFKIYPGGVQGDEKDVLRKIRINQLQGAGFTGVGMGTILPEVRILDTPYLFRNKKEVDYIINKFNDYFADHFEKKGFVLIGWAEVGYVYIFTNRNVKTLDDFKKLKIWMWEGDPVAQVTFKEFGVNPIPLSVTDVLTSLQTGLINTVYTSPLACIVLQWFTHLNYVSDIPLTNSMGAVLISKRTFNKIAPEYRQVVKEKGYRYFRRLTEISRKDNAASLQKMKEQGMKTLHLNTPQNIKEFQEIGDRTRRDLIGKFFDQTLVDNIQQALTEFRQKTAQKTGDTKNATR